MSKPSLTLGLGCDRDTPQATIEQAIREALARAGATAADVAAVASIDLKADEPGLLAAARALGHEPAFYPAAELATVPVPNPSETVEKHTGTPSVSEAAALLAAGRVAGWAQAAPMHALVIEKHRLRGADKRNATVSIARVPTVAQAEAPAKAGRIILVGLGPGAQEHMTARARQAIAEADTVIGYVTYIRLVADLVEGKEIIKKSMTEELDRAIEALAHARQGKTVALVSSGDAGVYGMAGPTYEVLLDAGWRPGEGIDVEIVPGASALNTCAALVGAPLTHDFCAISLSDLLTPWPVIARRLEAAASADFVTALYNPKSGRRTGQIVHAQHIFLRHRTPETPVALVKSAYRPKQRIVLSTLAQMCEQDIGMLTTVLIGNSNTFTREGLMITPRGYTNKYRVSEAGGRETRAGEQSGRSLTTGLNGWLAALRDSGQDAAALAAAHRLPQDYIEYALASAATAAPEAADSEDGDSGDGGE